MKLLTTSFFVDSDGCAFFKDGCATSLAGIKTKFWSCSEKIRNNELDATVNY